MRARLVSLLCFVVGAGEALAQCAMCNTATDASAAGRAYSVSVLFLLGTLAAVVGWLVCLAVRSSRRPGQTAKPGAGDGAARSS
jgi:drug/metabolite transporter superfamily protein YnfA